MRLSLTILTVTGAILITTACQRSEPSVTYASTPGISSTAPQSYAPLVDRVAPAVVTVHAAHRARPAQQFPFQNDPFFRRFFGNGAPQQPNGGGGGIERALGSGV